MLRRTMLTLVIVGGLLALAPPTAVAQQGQQGYAGGVAYPNGNAYGRRWGHTFSGRDYERFYHYPYVYYPHNYYSQEYFKSRNHLYHRYVPEMQIPVYNRHWFNYYPQYRKWHKGSHFILDTF